ncbi:S10 family peptidase [Alienimonas sp. DA493]|uniref:S10 family peptidase n=1 Tax=Alienimonas sp. DA493 TaxID=3373605 RepID=UPI003754EA24
MKTAFLLSLLLLGPSSAGSSLFAQDDDAAKKGGEEKTSPTAIAPVTTEHAVTIAGAEVAYTATAGTLPLVGEDEDPEADAQVFYVAYTVKPKEGEVRPLTFCFNGGPGSSSVWLHMGMLGPKIVPIPDDASFPAPPYGLEDNANSLLDVTDLVFIDPVGTGYSRPAKDDDERSRQSEFSGYEKDLNSVAEFIHRYVTENGRWGSPKFLLGESYGTLRAAGLAGRLMDRYNMALNGIVFVSSVLDFATLLEDSNNDLPYVLFLPTLAATAHYHGQLSEEWQNQDVQAVYDAAKQFALGDYATALLKGVKPESEEGRAIAARFAELTGLSAEFVVDSNLRVGMQRFGKELLREENKTVGRFDSRYTAPAREAAGDRGDFDASGAALFAPFTSALYRHLRENLKVERGTPYEILTGKVHPWDYGNFTNAYVRSDDTLAEALLTNPALHLFFALGHYDLATPPAAAEYTVNRLTLTGGADERITAKFYPGGHMMYVHGPSLEQLRKDLVAFYEDALGK